MMEVGYLHFHVLLEWLKIYVNACKLGLGEYSKLFVAKGISINIRTLIMLINERKFLCPFLSNGKTEP
jgi:hypothetical protein